MASCSGSDRSNAECSEPTDGIRRDVRALQDVASAFRTQPDCVCDHGELVCRVARCSSACHTQPAVCSLVKPSSDDDDDDEHRWHRAGRTLRSFLSQTSETNLLFGNDDPLVVNAAFADKQELACRSLPRAYVSDDSPQRSSTSTSDTCFKLSDCQLLADSSHDVVSSSCSQNGLLVLDNDPQTSFLPLFSKLRQKVSNLDNGCQKELHPSSQQRRDRPKDHSNPAHLGTGSELSSSDESDNEWCRSKLVHRRRHCSSSRRRRFGGRWLDDWWTRSCSEEPEYRMAGRSSVNRHSSGKRRQKKSVTEKTQSASASLVKEDVPLPSECSPAKKQLPWQHDKTSFTDFLADVESNATESDSLGHVSDDSSNDADNDCHDTMIFNDESASVVAPVACSFHCIPPETSANQTLRLTASDSSSVCSLSCDKDIDCVSSDAEPSALLGNIHISDYDSCHSACSYGGEENNIDRNEVDSEWDAEQTAAAISTAAMSAAAASVQCGDGWQVSDGGSTLLASEWYSFKTGGELPSLDDCDEDDDDGHNDEDGFHLVDSDADDEFECDCPVCLMQQQHISDSWQDRERLLPSTTDSLTNYLPAGYSEDDGGVDADLMSFTFTGPDYQTSFNGGVTISSIFQDVVIQMLQYLPNLLTSPTPAPLTDDEFSRLPSLTISLASLGDSSSSCSICLSQFEESEEAKVLPCTHMFHILCIHTWLNKAGTCPVCRQNVIVSDSASAAGSGRHDNNDDDDTADH